MALKVTDEVLAYLPLGEGVRALLRSCEVAGYAHFDLNSMTWFVDNRAAKIIELALRSAC
jgi:hypothetical protein